MTQTLLQLFHTQGTKCHQQPYKFTQSKQNIPNTEGPCTILVCLPFLEINSKGDEQMVMLPSTLAIFKQILVLHSDILYKRREVEHCLI